MEAVFQRSQIGRPYSPNFLHFFLGFTSLVNLLGFLGFIEFPDSR